MPLVSAAPDGTKLDASGADGRGLPQTAAYTFAARLEAVSLLALLDTAGCFCSCNQFAFRTFVAGKNKNVTKRVDCRCLVEFAAAARAGQKRRHHGPAGRRF